MLEPVNTVLKAVGRLALLPGDTVLVAGQGPIGLMFTRLLALREIKVLASDLMETRLALAREFGAAQTVQVAGAPSGSPTAEPAGFSALAEAVERLSEGRGLDAAVVAVPVDAVVKEALALVRGAGQVLVFAHTRRGAQTPLDLATICVDEKDLIGSYSSDLSLQTEVAHLVFSRQLDSRRLVTHQFPLEQTAAAVALAANPTADSLKVMINHEHESKA
jgi:L-iditol 2-dehydrogenase